MLGLPADRRQALFGALGGQSRFPQGAGTQLAQLELMAFSQSRPSQPHDLCLPIHTNGRLHEDLCLRLFYAAADVFVIPPPGQPAQHPGPTESPSGLFLVRFLTQVTLYTRELGVAFGQSSFDTVGSHEAHGP